MLNSMKQYQEELKNNEIAQAAQQPVVPAEESKVDGDSGSQLLSSEFRISSEKTVEKNHIAAPSSHMQPSLGLVDREPRKSEEVSASFVLPQFKITDGDGETALRQKP